MTAESAPKGASQGPTDRHQHTPRLYAHRLQVRLWHRLEQAAERRLVRAYDALVEAEAGR